MRNNPCYLLFLAFFLLPAHLLFAQQPGVLSLKYTPLRYPSDYASYGFTDIRQTPDKGFILPGLDSTGITKTEMLLKGVRYDISSLTKTDSAGNVQWWNWPGYSTIRGIQVLPGGSFIIAGSKTSYTSGLYDQELGISKITAGGATQWSVWLGGSGDDWGNAVVNTGTGYMVAGNSSSNDKDITGNHSAGSNDGLLIKLDLNGTVQWKKMFGGTGSDTIHAILQSPDGGFIMAGSTTSSDGDVPGNRGQTDGWLFKTDSSGNILWKKNFGGSADDIIQSIVLTADSGIIAAGFTSSNNGDVSGNHGNTDVWMIRTDKNGNLLWSKCFGGSSYDYCMSVSATNTDAVLLSGFTESGDGDVSGKNGSGNADAWLLMVASDGNLTWQKCAGTANDDYGMAALALPGNKFIQAGAGYNNGRIAPGYDKMLVYLGNANTIKGSVFLDLNGDGFKNTGEPFFDLATVKAVNSNNGRVRTAMPFNGQFALDVDTGTFVSSVVVNHPYFTVIPASHTSSFSSYNNTDVADFVVQAVSAHKDLTIAVFPLTVARPGRALGYKVVFRNVGSQIIAGVTVRLVMDHKLSYKYGTPAPLRQTGDTLEWDYSQLIPMDTGVISLALGLGAPPAANIGDTINLQATISPVTGDDTPRDDTATIRQPVANSYDPNDKTERNGGVVSPEQVAGGDYLHYLIRFQNTGNDTAFNIFVRDTLEARLDWNSLEMVSASHPYNLQITDGNKLAWAFNNIKLADSLHNEPDSHGYIAYRIKPLPTVPVGDTIRNNASIYFDFNIPVKTNTQLTLVKSYVLSLPVLSGIQAGYCSNLPVQKIKITNIPTPDYQATITAKLDGGSALTIAADSTVGINPSALAAGSHTLTISFTNSTGTKTTSAGFTVTAVVTPDVNVSANITTVINLTDNVIVTAGNAAGGGATPLYTFARDRAMTNVLQAESVTNTLTIAPGTLAVGVNWIYVRMKTSSNCFTVQTNTDSVKVERSAVTGLVDVDNPNQIITVYPNPFKQDISISGLSAAKSYVVVISDATGKEVYRQQVNNNSHWTADRKLFTGGQYWLRLYDRKKNRLIGTSLLIRE